MGSITTSIGMQEVCADDANEEVAVTRADAWLYQAKAAGRNRAMGAAVPA